MTPERRAEIERTLADDKKYFAKNSFTNWRGNAWQAFFHQSMVDREELLKEVDELSKGLNACRGDG